MEKAIAIVNRHARPWRLSFRLLANRSTRPVHDRLNFLDLDLTNIDNREVKVVEENGLITNFSFNGQQYKLDDPARAPYNFVPLNIDILPAQELPDLSIFQEKRLSGSLKIFIENKTHFFIRKNNVSEDFFCIKDNEPIIPGSALRGLLRSLVEIVSWSEMEFVYKKKILMHRGMADCSKSLQVAYRKEREVIAQDEKVNEKVGLLKFSKGKFQIYPANCLGDTIRDRVTDIKYEFNVARNHWTVHPGNAPNYINNNNHAWKIGLPLPTTSPINVPDAVIKAYLDDDNRPKDANKKVLVDVLAMARSLDKFKNHIPYPKPPENILNQGVPVFFQINSDGEITSLGHTRNYRIPYRFSIGHHLIQEKQVESNLDFAKAIFGNTNEIASRVFVHDSKIKESKGTEGVESSKRTKLLLAPKPTTFQHYLEQPDGWKTQKEDLLHWGDAAPKQNESDGDEFYLIRGYKQYWHRETSSNHRDQHSWAMETFNNEAGRGTDQKAIKALKKGWKFETTIRFDNLTPEELGALLFVLQLPEGCCHKLGMGKPLGLGSVEITVDNLTIVDRKKRYKTLFDETGQWEEALEKRKVSDYQEKFEKHILLKLPDDDKMLADGTVATSLWDTPRLKHLKTLLTFEHNLNGASVSWLDRTRYMEIRRNVNGQIVNEFKFRPVLPLSTEVIEKDMYKKT